MELVVIKQDSQEWEYMWNWLANHPINQGLEEPKVAENNGEAWQYMGSYKNKQAVIHEFRHRLHPVTNGVYKASLQASSNFTEDQIENSAKIK
jgi:hypothetical protein